MEKIVTLLGQYGTPLVITSVVIYIAIRYAEIWLKKMERAAAVGVKGQEDRNKEEHTRLLELRKKVNETVNTSLDRLMTKAGADRAFIFEFHNGGVSLAGLPFLKMSNTYEVVDTGIVPQSYNLQSMGVAMFSGLIGETLNKDYVVVDVSNRIAAIRPVTYETLVVQGIHTSIFTKITDVKGRIIGYCGLDYVRAEHTLEEQETAPLLMAAAIELGALLSVTKKEEK